MAKKQTTKPIKIVTNPASSEEKYPTFITISAMLLILVRYAASFFPDERMWGFNHLAFTGKEFSIIFTLCCLILVLPFVYKKIIRDRIRMQKIQYSRSQQIIVSILLMIVIWIFPVKGIFLGDGFSYSAELFRYIKNSPYDGWLLFSSAGSAPITGYIYVAVTIAYLHITTWLLHINSMMLIMTSAWLICGMICSVFLVFGFFKLSKILNREYDKSSGLDLSLLSLFLLLPGTVFFFGYVEYYLFAYISAFFFILTSLNFIFHGKNISFPIFTFVLTTAFHISGLILLPALLFLFSHKKIDWDSGKIKKLYAVYSILIVIGGIFYYLIFGSGEASNRFLISLFPYHTSAGTQAYSLLSSYNMIDNLNLIFFLALIPTLLLIFYLISRKSNQKYFINDPSQKHTIAKGFAGILSISYCVLLLYGNSGFGKARDWDIFAPFGLATAVIGILFFVQINKKFQRYTAYSFFIIACNGFIPWMYVNLSEHASENYFRSIMQLDEKHILSDYALNGYEHLRKAYYTRGDDEHVLWTLKKKIELVGYPLDFHQAMILLQRQDSVQKRKLVEFLASRLTDLFARMKNESVDSIHAGSKKIFLDIAGEILFTTYKDIDKSLAFQFAEKMKPFAPDAPQLRIPEAEQLHADDPKYLEIYTAISKVNFTSAGLAYYCGLTFLLNNKTDEALSQLNFSQQLDPNYINAKFLLGVAYLNKRDTAQSKKYLTDFLRSEPNKTSSLVQSAKKYLRQIQR